MALDRTHLARLYQQSAPKILDYVYRHVSSLQDAEDILIDVFVAALESTLFSSLTEQEQLAWLWRVARNKVINLYRQARSIHHLAIEQTGEELPGDPVSNPEQVSIRQEEEDDLARLLAQLPPLQQQVLYLRFSENLRCAQIAARVGQKESSIRSLLSRVMKLLRQNYRKSEKGGNYDENRQ